jgi:hypothetical protein
LQANGLLSRFVTNQPVTGAYVEAWIRSMTRNMLGHPFQNIYPSGDSGIKTTQFYDRREDEVSFSEIERVGI